MFTQRRHLLASTIIAGLAVGVVSPAMAQTAEAAQAWIDKAEEEIYYLSHNESGRPTYKVVEI